MKVVVSQRESSPAHVSAYTGRREIDQAMYVRDSYRPGWYVLWPG